MDWLNIIESHFNGRKKAFLIFDENHVLRYISEYAKEILEIDESHIGFISLNELFPSSDKNPEFLVDADYSFQTVYDMFYTTPSGRSKELRINRDSDLQTIGEISGYIVWLEAKSRDITAVYRKVSSLDPFQTMGWLFEQNALGFILINKEGLIEKYNEEIKAYLQEPGDWYSRNLFTFPFLHQNDIAALIIKSMKNAEKPRTKIITQNYYGTDSPQMVLWSSFPLTDLEGTVVGAIITTKLSTGT